MKKTLAIFIICIFVILVGFVAYRLSIGNNSVVPGAYRTESSSQPSSPVDHVSRASEIFGSLPTGDTFSIGTSKGVVEIKNFYAHDPPLGEGYSIMVKETAGYNIIYDRADSSFWLAILKTPFSTWRDAAEQDFLQTLGITKEDACKLYVSVGITYIPGDPLNGKMLPLSFCSGNVK